jgi:hypothetical protein
LARRDFKNLQLKAKMLIVRYDNPLIIAYSEELDDDELIRLTLETFEYPPSSYLVSDSMSLSFSG